MLRGLLLLTVVVMSFANPTVNCEKVGNFTWSAAPVGAYVSFVFSVWAPVGLGSGLVLTDLSKFPTATIWGAQFYNTSSVYVAQIATSWEWDRDLTYSVTLRYFRPGEKWTVERYKCVWTYTYQVGGQTYTFTETRYYNLVVGEPPTEQTTVSFTVPRLWGSSTYSDSKGVTVGRSIAEGSWYDLGAWTLCASLPTEWTWPHCERDYRSLNVVTSGTSPRLWRALRISGVGEGEALSNGYVNATAPKPWYYTDYAANNDLSLSTATVTTDRSGPTYVGDVRDKPFSTKVDIKVDAVPSGWGIVEVRPPPPVPLYMSRVVLYRDLEQCRPPDCFVVNTVGNSTWAGDRWVWTGTLASVAIRTPFNLNPVAALRAALGSEVISLASADGVKLRVPYGSLAKLEASAMWWADIMGHRVWVNVFPTARLSVVDRGGNNLADQYESAAAAGKLWYKLSPGDSYSYNVPGVKWEAFYAAVDASRPSVVTAWYTPPDPCRQWPTQAANCVYSQHVFTKVNGTWVGYAKVGPRGGAQWPIAKLELVDWLMPYALLNYKSTDLLALLGYPHVLLWHTYKISSWAFNPQTGDFDIQLQNQIPGPFRATLLSLAVGYSQYRNTTDTRGRPYYQISALPDWYYNYAFQGVGGDELPGGWADVLPLGISSMTSNSTAPWAVFLVSTTACPSLICPRIDPVLWGPAPGPTADLALPGAGYSFLVAYLGKGNKTTIRIYAEAGYVVNETGGSVRHTFGRNILLAEVSKTWRFLDGVYVGPGWYLDYKPLKACESMPAGSRSMYVTPDNYTGPLRLIIEEVETGKKYHFVFFVGAEAQIYVSSTSAAPEELTAPQLNTTAYLYLNGVPYFHGLPAFGEGGRQYAFRCVPAAVQARSYLGEVGYTSQLAASGDFWSELELWVSASVRTAEAKPSFELVDSNKSIVRIRPADPDAPVVGYAFYLMRGGAWRKVAEVGSSCVLVNASLAMPWDPVLVLPVVRQDAWVRQGDAVVLWRPVHKLLFKAWAGEPWLPLTQFNQTHVRPCSP
ncbi:MAG: hypothetical protein QXP31_03345 [Pyrobaculum sp.]